MLLPTIALSMVEKHFLVVTMTGLPTCPSDVLIKVFSWHYGSLAWTNDQLLYGLKVSCFMKKII